MLNHNESFQFLDDVVVLVKQYITAAREKQIPVVDFKKPSVLRDDASLSIGKIGRSPEELLEGVHHALKHSVATQHPRFFNQLYAGADIVGIIGELIEAVLNTSMATYEISPLFTLMEQTIFEKVARYLDRKIYDGMMFAGGSASNMQAMQLARFRLDYGYHERGLYDSPRLGVFTSDQAHYSISKAAMLMGLGKKNVIKVKTDDTGAMIVSDLQEKIHEAKAQGIIPFFINTTAGTTVSGAYDPFELIVEVGEVNNMRVHVDGARGGLVLFSEKLRKRLGSLKRVDSFTWNPHKMMGVPLQCSVFMTRHVERNAKCNTVNAQYLFNEDKGYSASCDTGDKYTQCGRKTDIFKLWLQRQSYGDKGLSQRVEGVFAHAAYLTKQIKSSDRLLLVAEPTCTNVCFWYLPSDIDKATCTHETIKANFKRIHTLTAQIKDEMLRRGEMMVTYTPMKDLPNFFRMVFIRHDIEQEDIDFVVHHITLLGKDMENA